MGEQLWARRYRRGALIPCCNWLGGWDPHAYRRYSGDAANDRMSSNPVTVTVAPVSQTITFGALANKALAIAPITIAATASSGLPVSFTSTTLPVCTVVGTTVTLVTTGTCTIQADQPGDSNYPPAPPVTQGFTVTPGSQTITFGTLLTQALGTAPFAVSATASSAWQSVSRRRHCPSVP